MQQMIFIADFIACSTCFGQYYAHHQEFESVFLRNARKSETTFYTLLSSQSSQYELQIVRPRKVISRHIHA